MRRTLGSLLLAVTTPAAFAACTPAVDAPFQLIGDVNDLDTYGQRTCLLDGTGAVRCRGVALPGFGEVDGVRVSIGAPVPAHRVAVGARHACVAHPGGVSCWGNNDDNVLGVGLGDCPPPATPDAAPPPCNLTSRLVDGLGDVRELDAGDRFTCAISGDDVVRCWGLAAGGRLGRAVVTAVAAPAQVVTVDGDALAAQHLSVAAGHGCAVDLDGALWCWGGGWGASGAVLVDAGPFTAVAVGADHLCVIDVGGKVRCRGENLNGESGDPEAARRCADRPCPLADHVVVGPQGATTVAVGARHSCASDRATGALWCWGSNELGQLGRSDAFLVGAPGPVDEVRDVVEVVAGTAHTCAITDQGLGWCWGLDAGTCAGDCR